MTKKPPEDMKLFTVRCDSIAAENMPICAKLKRHDNKMYYINQIGKMLEKVVSVKSNIAVINDSCTENLSLDEVFGQCLRKIGEMIENEDILRSPTAVERRQEIMHREQTDDLASKLNSIFLVPIQRIRCFNRLEIFPLFMRFSELSDYIERNRTLQHATDRALPADLTGIEMEMRLSREMLDQKLNACSTNINELKHKIKPLMRSSTSYGTRSVGFSIDSNSTVPDKGSVMYLSAESKKSSIQTEDFRDQIYPAKLRELNNGFSTNFI